MLFFNVLVTIFLGQPKRDCHLIFYFCPIYAPMCFSFCEFYNEGQATLESNRVVSDQVVCFKSRNESLV